MNTQNLKIVSETEKAIQFEVGFKFNENAPQIVYGTNGNENLGTGYIVTSWVPKSIIIDGNIPAWFFAKEIAKKFNPMMDTIFS